MASSPRKSDVLPPKTSASNVLPFKRPVRKAPRNISSDSDYALPAGLELPEDRSSECDEWCAPLHLIAAKIAGQPWAKNFDVDDFMIMSRVVDEHGTITHYKHRDTRRYINVDNEGRTSRYNERHWRIPELRHGYSETLALQEAIEALDLDWLDELR